MANDENQSLELGVDSNEISDTLTLEVWDEFFPKLASFAKSKMKAFLQREVDEEDIALSAIHSFFNGVKEGKYTIRERGELWKLLATIAIHKIVRQNRRFFAAKRGSGKVRGESVFEGNRGEQKNGLDQFVDKRRMPELQEQIIASCDEMLNMLSDEKLRKTALMRMNGYSNQEISTELNCSVARTKQRIGKIKQLWSNVEIDR